MADEAAYLLADEDAGLLGGVRAQARRRSRKRWALGTTAALCVVAGLSRDRGRLSVWNFAPSVLAPALAPPLLPAGQRCGVPGLRRAAAQGFLDGATRAPGSHRPLPYWSKAARVDGCEVHAVTLELRHTHLDELEAAVLAASTPGHARFRQFWTADEVRALTTDAADAATVEAWLAGLGLEAHATRSGGFVTVKAPVHAIERMFECTMFLWAKTLAGDGSVYRCDGDYSLPAAVYASVHAVYGVAELPVLLGGAKRHVEILDGSDVRGHDRRITPQKLQRFYGIDAEYMYASGPPTRATQALFETIGQEYSPRDLRTFDGFFDLPVHENLTSVGGHVVDRCDDPGDCAEGNLDVQYMTALAPRAPTTFFYVDDDQDFDDPFVLFAMRVSNMEHPPLVTSISYGSLETALVPSVMRSFNVAAMKLALNGVTNIYALKMLVKHMMAEMKQTHAILYERRVLKDLKHPFVLRLLTTYQSMNVCYFLLELVQGGELFSRLTCFAMDAFPMDEAKFYASTTMDALCYIHSKSIVYRDLKPENILIDAGGYIRIVDFGFAKVLKTGDQTYTIVGTPEYLAPECVLGQGYRFDVDLWAFGCLVYEMHMGATPFAADDPSDTMQIFKQIQQAKVKFLKKDTTRIGGDTVQLCQSLLDRNRKKRLGNLKGGGNQIKEHPYFEGTDFKALHSKSVDAPFKPPIKGTDDMSLFDDYDEDMDIAEYHDDQRIFDEFASEIIDDSELIGS